MGHGDDRASKDSSVKIHSPLRGMIIHKFGHTFWWGGGSGSGGGSFETGSLSLGSPRFPQFCDNLPGSASQVLG